jgi:hypothetical protein
MPGDQLNRARWRRHGQKQSASYDQRMRFFDRVLSGDSRAWACVQATGPTLGGRRDRPEPAVLPRRDRADRDRPQPGHARRGPAAGRAARPRRRPPRGRRAGPALPRCVLRHRGLHLLGVRHPRRAGRGPRDDPGGAPGRAAAARRSRRRGRLAGPPRPAGHRSRHRAGATASISPAARSARSAPEASRSSGASGSRWDSSNGSPPQAGC